MAKIKRNITPKTGGKELSSRKWSFLPRRIQRIIPFVKPIKPDLEISNNNSESPDGSTGENTTTETTSPNTGNTGSTDPGTTSSTSSTNSTMEPIIGEIKMFAGNFAPKGWAFCDGQILAINQYSALFSILGKIYGGDGRTNFALPDLRGRGPLHPGQGTGLSDYNLGQSGGSESEALSINQIPSHNHSVNYADESANSTDPNNRMMARGSQTIFGDSDQQSAMNSQMINNAGGNQAHNNMQPFLAINFIIALEGVYPSRN